MGLRPVDVAIAGGGLAGLALALDLARAGRRVALCERRSRPGGAVAAVATPLGDADNSVHLFLAGFEHALGRLASLGVRDLLVEAEPRYRLLIDGAWHRLELPVGLSGWLSAAANLGGLRAAGGSGLELLPTVARLLLGAGPRGGDAAAWLAPALAGRPLAALFWREWILSVFNAPWERVDAALFARTARRLFARPGRTRPLVARASLEELWIRPFERALADAGVELRLGCPVRGAERAGDRLSAWLCDDGPLEADRFVWAAPPEAAAALPGLEGALPDWPLRRGFHIANLLLEADGPPAAGAGLTGFFGEPFQWVFAAGPGRIALVASGLDDAALEDRAALEARGRELATLAGCRPRGEGRLLVQRQATALQDEAFEAARPGHGSPLANLHWCGAWTATGLPLSMESALASAASLRDLLLEAPPAN